jgi:hypothetical protein
MQLANAELVPITSSAKQAGAKSFLIMIPPGNNPEDRLQSGVVSIGGNMLLTSASSSPNRTEPLNAP